MEILIKTCTKCNTQKSITEFYKNNKNNKLSSQCKKCENERRKKNYSLNPKILTKEQKEEMNKRRRDLYNVPNSLYKQRVQKEKKKYYEKIIDDCFGNYYQANKEKLKEQIRKYKKTDKGKAVKKNYQHKRRALMKGDVDSSQLKELYKNTKSCYWCNNKLVKNDIHLDHYYPISLGGKHTISNLVLSCSKCNLTKGSKDPLVFANQIGKLF